MFCSTVDSSYKKIMRVIVDKSSKSELPQEKDTPWEITFSESSIIVQLSNNQLMIFVYTILALRKTLSTKSRSIFIFLRLLRSSGVASANFKNLSAASP